MSLILRKQQKKVVEHLAHVRGHGDEGFGCAWSPHERPTNYMRERRDHCGWDIATAKGGGITPACFASRGESAVADVQYSPKDPYTICAAGDDKALVSGICGPKATSVQQLLKTLMMVINAPSLS